MRPVALLSDFTVLSLDATDISGESSAGGGYANNGEIHKIRIDASGKAIGLGEYIPPRRFGFMLGKPRQVHLTACMPLAAVLWILPSAKRLLHALVVLARW